MLYQAYNWCSQTFLQCWHSSVSDDVRLETTNRIKTCATTCSCAQYEHETWVKTLLLGATSGQKLHMGPLTHRHVFRYQYNSDERLLVIYFIPAEWSPPFRLFQFSHLAQKMQKHFWLSINKGTTSEIVLQPHAAFWPFSWGPPLLNGR